jgi:hypothetical protein
MGLRDARNPMGVPMAGWITSNGNSEFALPTAGTADALIEIYRGKSGGRDAETSVIWGRGEPYIHISSDRGPDIISILKRIGDAGIYGFIPPQRAGDTLFLYVRDDCSRRAWAVVRSIRKDEGEQDGDPPDDAQEPEDEDEGEQD